MVKRPAFINFNLVFKFDDWKFDEESFELLKWLLLNDEISHTDLLLLEYLVEDEIIKKKLKVLVISIEISLSKN